MKLTSKIVAVLLALCVLTTSLFAAENQSLLEMKSQSNPDLRLTPPPAASADQKFSGNEFALLLGTGYNLDKGNLFKEAYDLNLYAGAQYFLTKYIGIEAEVPFYQTKGTSVREVSGGPLFRIPLFDTVAPYVGPAVTYDWVAGKFAYYARAGFDVRLVKGWGVFAEGNYNIKDFNGESLKNGSWSVKGGLKLVF